MTHSLRPAGGAPAAVEEEVDAPHAHYSVRFPLVKSA